LRTTLTPFFQAGRILRLVDGTLAVGHVANAAFCPAQRHQALCWKFVQQFLARAIEVATGMVMVSEQEGDEEWVDF
jgi:type III secretory pathway component EscT